jgi:pimeloyl-ACP methyl ester carboxylesterase
MQYDVRGFAPAADGTRLFYGVKGQGPSLLLLDGIGCDGWAWVHIQPHLAERFEVVHTHYRGHGRSASPVDPEQHGIETLADDALHVLDALEIEQTIPIVHSMGTQVALELYRKEPERVRALIFVCGAPGHVTQTFHGNDLLHRSLPMLIERVRRHRALFRGLWGHLPPAFSYRVARWLGEVDGTALQLEDFRRYVEHTSDLDLDLYLAMLKSAGDHTAEDVLPKITVPTLVIAAEKDTFTPIDVLRAMAKAIPNADYLELPGASHAAPAERADLINQRIDTFLDALPRK